MPGPGRELQVRLYRDSLTTPWGFRLHGGKDVKAPLTVQKVAAGSPVFGELQRDDVILEIQNNDATNMTHKQAQDMIRNAGGSMLLRVRRSGRLDAPPMTSYDGSTQRGFMLGRVKNTLSGVVTDTSPTGGFPGYNNNYSSDYSPTSSYASADSSRPVKTWNLPKPAFKAHPSMAGNLMEPGWTPECLRHPQRRQQPQPVRQFQPPSPHHKQYPDPAHHNVPVPVHHVETGPPAWYGSLRPSGNAHQSDERVAGVAPHHRSMSPDYGRQAPVATAAAWSPPGAAGAGNNGVMNLQYNTPLGLYSKANAQEALSGQMSGLAVGDSSGVRTESDVYRLVHDTDKASGGRRGRPAAGDLHLHAPQRHDDATRQSPSMNILESRFVGQSDGAGMSDF